MRGKSSPKSEIAVAPAAGTGFETNEPMEEGLAKKKIRPNGFFKRMSDDRLIEYTQEFMNGKGITTRKGLQKADSGLRAVLRRRNLLGQTIPESKQEGYRERRDWTAMTDLELIEFTQEVMNGKGITTRRGLEKADRGLYSTLLRRGLLERVGFGKVRRKGRDWAIMSDDELVKAAQEFMNGKGITMRNGLAKADRGLHTVLRRRNLLGQVIPESANELHRDWVGMSDERIVEFTQEFMKGKGITTRRGLEKADSGLKDVLKRRKLIDRVFAEIDEKRQEESLDAVCEALDAFGEDG